MTKLPSLSIRIRTIANTKLTALGSRWIQTDIWIILKVECNTNLLFLLLWPPLSSGFMSIRIGAQITSLSRSWIQWSPRLEGQTGVAIWRSTGCGNISTMFWETSAWWRRKFWLSTTWKRLGWWPWRLGWWPWRWH